MKDSPFCYRHRPEIAEAGKAAMARGRETQKRVRQQAASSGLMAEIEKMEAQDVIKRLRDDRLLLF